MAVTWQVCLWTLGGVKEQMARYLMFPSRLVAAVQGKWRTKSPLALENLQGSTAQQCCDRNLCVACRPNQSCACHIRSPIRGGQPESQWINRIWCSVSLTRQTTLALRISMATEMGQSGTRRRGLENTIWSDLPKTKFQTRHSVLFGPSCCPGTDFVHAFHSCKVDTNAHKYQGQTDQECCLPKRPNCKTAEPGRLDSNKFSEREWKL